MNSKSSMRKLFLFISCALFSIIFSNCSGSSSDSGDKGGAGESALTITSVFPAQDAVDVEPDEAVVVTFSTDIDPDTISTSTILVSNGQEQIQGGLAASANTVTFTPSPIFSWGTTYTVTVTTGVRDRGGASAAGDYSWSFTTINAKELGKWIMVAAGWDNGAAINENGTLWVWGCNYSGQLGIGTGGDHDEVHRYDSHVPIQMGVRSDWSDVSLGLHYSLAVRNDGTMWAWGDGYLGDGSTITKKLPVRIGLDSGWKSVEASMAHFSLATSTQNTVWSWGLNTYGQLGNGTAGEGQEIRLPVQIGPDTDWEMLSAGKKHVAAIKADGSLWAWGSNWYGQLGDGTGGDRTVNHDSPVPVRIGSDSDWRIVSARGESTMGIKEDGSLWAWGVNQYGQLGDGTNDAKNVPVRIGDETDWSLVAAGWYHTVAVKNDGTLWAWGANTHGQFGDGTAVDRNTPVQVGADADWSTVSAGKDLTFGIKEDGSLWAWGYNNFGQVGDGTIVDKLVPTRIK